MAYAYDYMEIDRSMMVRHFKLYERFKKADKRSEEYLKVRDYVGNLEIAASLRRADTD